MRMWCSLRVPQTKGQFNGDIWLGFERLTCVPIQTKMVKEVMLSKEERQWLKVRRLLRFVSLVNAVCSPRVLLVIGP